MTKKAKQYTAEEKARIALEAIKGELTIAQIVSKYGVHATQVSFWKKQAQEYLVSAFKDKSTRSRNNTQDDLIKQLYEQIGQLSVERDWLKKKSALFGLGG